MAGFVYNITPEPTVEERYDVSTGIRRRGPYRLDTTNLNVGDRLPSFLPVYADLVNKKCYLVCNVEVYEAYTSGSTSLKIKKGSYIYVGMHIGNGAKGATVSAIDKSNARYDVLTITDFGANLTAGTVLYQATSVAGTAPLRVANSALYETHTVTVGDNLVALLSAAREIEPTKLVVPFSSSDKAKLGSDFQFNE